MGNQYEEEFDENSDIKKIRNRLGKLLLVISYFGIWSIAVAVYWLFTSGSDAMGYSLLFLYFLLPVTTFVVSLLLGFFHFWGHFKWLGAPVLGFMYMMAEYATFSVSNTIAFQKLNKPHFSMMIAGVIISLVAMGIGHMGYFLRRKLKE